VYIYINSAENDKRYIHESVVLNPTQSQASATWATKCH